MNKCYIWCLLLLSLTGCNLDRAVNVLSGNELIYINDGAVQCESQGMTKEESAQLLIDRGVDVVSSYCGAITGLVVAAQCGLGDMNINIHEINSQNVPDAQEAGFEPVSSLEQQNLGYQLVDCQ